MLKKIQALGVNKVYLHQNYSKQELRIPKIDLSARIILREIYRSAREWSRTKPTNYWTDTKWRYETIQKDENKPAQFTAPLPMQKVTTGSPSITWIVIHFDSRKRRYGLESHSVKTYDDLVKQCARDFKMQADQIVLVDGKKRILSGDILSNTVKEAFIQRRATVIYQNSKEEYYANLYSELIEQVSQKYQLSSAAILDNDNIECSDLDTIDPNLGPFTVVQF